MARQVQCLDLTTMKAFYKELETYAQQKAFILKCKHGRKIKVLGFDYDSQQEYLELSKHM